MSNTIRANPVVELPVGLPDSDLLLSVYPEGDSCIVHATGELDLATRNQLFAASSAGHHPSMVIDLAGITFMDCSGYCSLVASRLVIELGGRTLTIRGEAGQPARLLELIATLDNAKGDDFSPLSPDIAISLSL